MQKITSFEILQYHVNSAFIVHLNSNKEIVVFEIVLYFMQTYQSPLITNHYMYTLNFEMYTYG